MSSCVKQLLGSICWLTVAIMFIGCASNEVQTLTSSTVDQVMFAIAGSETIQSDQQGFPSVVTLKRFRKPSGEWDFKIDMPTTIKKPKEGNSFIVIDLSLLRRPTRKLSIEPNMLVLDEPGTTNKWQGVFWIPASEKGTSDASTGAWAPSGSALILSSKGIGYSYIVMAIPEPVSEQDKRETGLISFGPAGPLTISGQLPKDALRLMFEVPTDFAQKPLSLKILDRTIGEVPKSN
jgi:hypothetical protein